MSELSLSGRIDEFRRRAGSDRGPELPRHPEVASWRTATVEDIDAIHAVMVAAERVDHPTWTTPREDVADTFDLAHIDHSRDTVLALDAAGAVIAFGSSFLHPSREGALNVHLSGAVLPSLWRRGIGRAVFGWQYARGLEQLAEAARALPDAPDAEWTAQLRVYAEEHNLGNQRLAESAGLAAERWVRDDAARSGGRRAGRGPPGGRAGERDAYRHVLA